MLAKIARALYKNSFMEKDIKVLDTLEKDVKSIIPPSHEEEERFLELEKERLLKIRELRLKNFQNLHNNVRQAILDKILQQDVEKEYSRLITEDRSEINISHEAFLIYEKYIRANLYAPYTHHMNKLMIPDYKELLNAHATSCIDDTLKSIKDV